jgi:hypothetical protein
MTATLRRALDRRPVAPAIRTVLPLARAPHRQTLPIRAALEWAFGVEHASLDFAEAWGDNARPGVSPLWTVMQRGALGCKVDGGGWSAPARDADIIASAVAHLPADVGGRAIAIRVAELARAGSVPDWGRDLRPRCIPVAWRCENQFGPSAATEIVGVERIRNRGRVRDFPVLACPVTFTTTAARIGAARKQYHDWVEALARLAMDLRARGILDRVTITAALPDPEPWATVEARRRVG